MASHRQPSQSTAPPASVPPRASAPSNSPDEPPDTPPPAPPPALRQSTPHPPSRHARQSASSRHSPSLNPTLQDGMLRPVHITHFERLPMPTPQTLKNHTRLDPPYHFFILPMLLLNLIFSIYVTIHRWPEHWALHLWWIA